MIVEITETKNYLRVDGDYDDALIKGMMLAGQEICLGILRIEESEVDAKNEQLRTAIFYAVSYLYEHREEADHAALVRTLKALLSGIRKEAF